MPVKKTFKTTTKKTPVKKAVTKKTIKATATKPNVIVETKKTQNSKTKKCDSMMKILITILLLLNLIFGIINLLKTDSALQLEELKVGGSENLEKVMELYNSEVYKEQQSAAIQQFMMGQ